MREVQRSAIVPHPAAAMFALVADIEAYPQFLPGCTGSRVVSRTPDAVVASLSFAKGPMKAAFTTSNMMQPPGRIGMQLLDGPFRELEGEWLIRPLGDDGCEVSLRVRFEFDNAASDLVLGPVFAATCNGLVDAFVKRARAVYG